MGHLLFPHKRDGGSRRLAFELLLDLFLLGHPAVDPGAELGVLALQSVDFFPARALEETRGSVKKRDGGSSLLCRFDGREQFVATRGQRFSSVVAALLLLLRNALFRGTGGR